MLYDQLIEFAQEKQRRRRYQGIHKSVPCPIVVIVLGDTLGRSLDALYHQLSGRWSSQLDALQIGYCYINEPYTGSAPILQAMLGLPEEGQSGAGTLCLMPEALRTVNDMVGNAIRKISDEPEVSMAKADIHLILAPEDPAQAFATDIAAVARGRFQRFGTLDTDCRFYFILPIECETQVQMGHMRAAIEQLKAADSDSEEYTEEVLLLQSDAPPQRYHVGKVVQSVMLLDEMNESFQRYNAHGERIMLIADLIENGWNGTGFIQTAGAQNGVVGPEYWLAQATNELCIRVTEDRPQNEINLRDIYEEIMRLSELRMRGVERAFDGCCLFNLGQVSRINNMDSQEAEKRVFGNALEYAYEHWLKHLPAFEITETLKQMFEQIESRDRLIQLANELHDWAENYTRHQTVVPSSRYQAPLRFGNESESVQRFRSYLIQKKYLLKCENDKQICCAELAGRCAEYCREQADRIASERETFLAFAEEARETWFRLRERYNEGRPMPLRWINQHPPLSELRRLGVKAAEEGESSQFLSLVAECVDLEWNSEGALAPPEIPVYCRLTVALGLQPQIRQITDGAAQGHIIKTLVIANRYQERDMRRVFVFNSVM